MAEKRNDKKSKRELERSLNEIKKLREELKSLTDDSKRKQLITELFEKTDALEENVNIFLGEDTTLKKSFNDIDDQITILQKDLEEQIQAYDDCSNKMDILLREEEKALDENTLTEEELNTFQSEMASRKLSINQDSCKIKRKIGEDRKLLSILRARKNQAENDLEEATSIGIYPASFENVDSVIHEVAVIRSTLKNKNLSDVMEKEAAERTEEEKQQIETIKKDMIHESSEANLSPLDSIDCLYLVHDAFGKDSEMIAKDIVIKKKQLDTLQSNIKSIPQKIKGVEKNSDYIPDKAPSDLENIAIHYQEDFHEPYVLEKSENEASIHPEKILLLYNTDENAIYVDQALIERFHFIPVEEKNVIGKGYYYRINEKDVTYIFENQNNDYSPYTVEKEDFTFPEEVKKTEEEKTVDVISLYRKKGENSERIYATVDTLKRFGVFPHEDCVVIKGTPYYSVREEDLNKIQSVASLASDKMLIEYQELKEDKKEKKEEKDSKPYTPSNVNATEAFLEELKDGETAYNIIHSVPNYKKASNTLLQYLTDSFNHTVTMDKYEEWLSQLTEKDLQEFLHKNNSFESLSTLNSKILEKIKSYVLKELEVNERLLRHNYLLFFHNIGLIKALEEGLTSPSIDREEASSYILLRRNLLEDCSKYIQEILVARQVIDDLVGNDVLVNTAVLNKEYPYIGMKYKKEVAPELIPYKNDCYKQLELSIEDKNYEGVISYFIKSEGCYYDDMEATIHVSGTRSIGFKYYDILANQFNFRKDSMTSSLLKSEASALANMKAIRRMRLQDVKTGNLLESRNEDLWKDLDMNNWHIDSSMDIYDDLKSMIVQYENNMIGSEEVLQKINSYVEFLKRQLVNVVNEIIDYLREYASHNSEVDIDSIQEKLEYLIVHPEEICKYDLDKNDVLLRLDLPDAMLSSIILSATSVGFMKQINQSLQKENNREKGNVK